MISGSSLIRSLGSSTGKLLRRLPRHSRALIRGSADGTNDSRLPFSRVEYADRRHAVLSRMESGSVALFPSAMPLNMSEDVPYLYHQNTDISYLCGCQEPGAVLVLDSTQVDAMKSQEQALLFLRPRDFERECWDGPMLGVSSATRHLFGVDAVYPDYELRNVLADRLAKSSCHQVYMDPAVNTNMSTGLMDGLSTTAQSQMLSKWSRSILPKSFVSHSRLIKSPAERSLLQQAASIMASAMNDGMAFSILRNDADAESQPPSLPERHIEARLEYSCKVLGASRMAFPSVVASGRNGTTLHYMANCGLALDGDLVMVDAGCQYEGYCSDISRTWPVGGKFSSPQRELYELVLDVQLRCIDLSRVALYGGSPISLNVIHSVAAEELTRGLKELGFMNGLTVEEALATGSYSKWFNHAIGHYLGMDVHDTHAISKSKPLQAGMCITIEPGLYVRVDDESAPEQFRGIGIRIEVSNGLLCQLMVDAARIPKLSA
jgi:Xaa-Pro aminopeptidase